MRRHLDADAVNAELPQFPQGVPKMPVLGKVGASWDKKQKLKPKLTGDVCCF